MWCFLFTRGGVRRAEIHSFPVRFRKIKTARFCRGEAIGKLPRQFLPCRKNRRSLNNQGRINFCKIEKALISLHFGNPELHNNLLASQHPNVGRCSDIGSALQVTLGRVNWKTRKISLIFERCFAEVSCLRLAVKKLVILSFALVLCLGYAPTATAAGKSAKGHHKNKRKASWKKKGQQGIKSERAMEIQQALIREKYLTGEPTGTWDARTQAALVKYQGDNGWQTKVVPDSRALIKLGLGPNYSAELLNRQPKASPAGTPSTTASRGIEGTAGKQ
jgi:hypothetical protein